MAGAGPLFFLRRQTLWVAVHMHPRERTFLFHLSLILPCSPGHTHQGGVGHDTMVVTDISLGLLWPVSTLSTWRGLTQVAQPCETGVCSQKLCLTPECLRASPPCFKGVKGLKHDNCSKIVLKICYFYIIKSYKVIKVLLIVVDLDGIVYQVHQISERQDKTQDFCKTSSRKMARQNETVALLQMTI